MSKNSQRKTSEKENSKKRYEDGVRQAQVQKDNAEWYDLKRKECPVPYYQNCMAWRKGFLSSGGVKFW